VKRAFQVLYMDLWRSFISIEFLLATVGVCLVYYIGCWSELKFSHDVLNLFKFSSVNSTFYLILVLVAVLPYSTSFCSDWNSQYIKPTIIRNGITKYCFSKIITCALSSGCAFALGMAIFIISLRLSLGYPLVTPSEGDFTFYATRTLGGEFLLSGHYILYFLIYIFFGFLTGALWSVVGLYASTYIPNRFVSLCTPFIIYYASNIFTRTFPVWLRLNRITEGMCIIKGTLESLVYATVLFSFLTLIIGVLFLQKVKRRLANG
jgi:hypothetical protein